MKKLDYLVKCEHLELKLTKTDNGLERIFIFPAFEIVPGDFVLVHGDNGSGKSTLLKFIYRDLHEFDNALKIQSGSLTYGKAFGFDHIPYHLLNDHEEIRLHHLMAFARSKHRALYK